MQNTADTKLWFGKHKGKRLSEVPREYLDWCLEARAGGGELVEAIANFLLVPVPKKKVHYESKTITPIELSELAIQPGFHPVNSFCKGVDVMAVCNCYNRFDPTSSWPVKEPEVTWDGKSAPFDLDESMEDREFKAMFG